MFFTILGGAAVESGDSVPQWSGQFEVIIGEDVGLMRVHNSDVRQHFAPAGWEATGHSTFDDGSLETYTYKRIGSE